MTASDLSPTLTITTSGPTSTTSPVKIMPGRIRWLARLCSNISLKLSVKGSFIHSLGRFRPHTPQRIRLRGSDITGCRILQPQLSQALPSSPQLARAAVRVDLVRHLAGIQSRRVQNDRICSRHERRCGPRHITAVALRNVERKGFETNTRILVFQLLIAPSGALLNARGEEYFELGARKDHRPHVAPVGDQAGRAGEGALALEQRLPDGGPGRDARGAGPGHLAPQGPAD